MRRRSFVSLALLALLGASASVARAQIPAGEYATRRDSVAARIGDGALVAFGQREPVTDPFFYQQLAAFKYLTGFDEPDAAFLLVARGARVERALLYVPARAVGLALFLGFLPDSARLAASLGLGLTTLDHLRPDVDALVAAGVPLNTLLDWSTRDSQRTDSLTRGRRFLQLLRDAHPGLAVRELHPLLDSLMVRKSPAELALIRHAASISIQGQVAAMKVVRPGASEAAAQAEAEYVFRGSGGDGPGYTSIVGSGPNSTSYHYRANNRVMRSGEVVVMDMAAAYGGYTADVTRTLPVSGRFTAEQRAIYQIVRDAQDAAARAARPGSPVSRGDSAIRAVEAAGLARLGLIESPDAMIDPPWPADCQRRPLPCRQAYLYMAHGPGHGIGLEVHDVGGYSYSPTGHFQVGEPFTIEPGIYISTMLLDMLPDTPRNRQFIARVRPVVQRLNNTGIRIEDDYVVTPTGVEWITRGPREWSEVEAAMRK
ncbi:MAG TPA: aminopeptidase P N-terminal domain-containing protein [Longimicrobiales bacterium]